jgi:Na+/H+ antiporter NhaC
MAKAPGKPLFMPLPPTSQLTAAEDSLPVAALLAASGGFLDAFTYIGQGHVFANAMTGNVVLLGVYAATGNWTQSWRSGRTSPSGLLCFECHWSIRRF